MALHEVPSNNPEDATAAGSEVTLSKRSAAEESVSDVLLEVPGARPYRTGTLGSFTSASLRGSDFAHTTILLGDLPISRGDGRIFNLDTLPISMFDSMVVYRGGAPVWLSQGAIGGVIQLMPKKAETSEFSGTLSAGSFGYWGALSDFAVAPDESLSSVFSRMGMRSSQGNFKHIYDDKSSLTDEDDYAKYRENADVLDGYGLVYFRAPIGEGFLDLVLMGFERLAGEPGSVAVFTHQARRNYSRGSAILSYQQSRYTRKGQRLFRYQILGGGTLERTRFTDISAEINEMPTRTDDLGHDEFASAKGSLSVTEFLEFSLVGSYRFESFKREDSLEDDVVPASSRHVVAGAFETNLHGDVWNRGFEIRPSIRYEMSEARVYFDELREVNLPEVNSSRVQHLVPTYRLAGVMELLRGVALSASIASGKRMPNMLELFGDGAFLRGTHSLDHERSLSYDIGLNAQGKTGPIYGGVEIHLFSLKVDDRIIYVKNSQEEMVPRNLRSSQIYGIETGLQGNLTRYFRLSLAVTLLDTEGKEGKELPNRAKVVTHVRPELILGPFGFIDKIGYYVESNFISSTYDEPDNVRPAKPNQHFINTGVSFEFLQHQWLFLFTLRDLFDTQGQDFRGFLLPGRMVVASLTYRKDLL